MNGEIENIPKAVIPDPVKHPTVRPKRRKKAKPYRPAKLKDEKQYGGTGKVSVSDFLQAPSESPGDIVDALMRAADYSKPQMRGGDPEQMKKLSLPDEIGKKTSGGKKPKAKANKRPSTFGLFEAEMRVENMPRPNTPPPTFRSGR